MDKQEEVQLIEHNHFLENLVLRPARVVRLYINNFVYRTISILRAYDGEKFPFLQCTSGGVLKTTQVGAIYEDNYTYTGSAPDTYGAGLGFSEVMSCTEIWVSDYGLELQRTTDGVAWEDPIPLDVGTYYVIDASTLDLRLKNAVPGSTAKYKVVAWC